MKPFHNWLEEMTDRINKELDNNAKPLLSNNKCHECGVVTNDLYGTNEKSICVDCIGNLLAGAYGGYRVEDVEQELDRYIDWEAEDRLNTDYDDTCNWRD